MLFFISFYTKVLSEYIFFFFRYFLIFLTKSFEYFTLNILVVYGVTWRNIYSVVFCSCLCICWNMSSWIHFSLKFANICRRKINECLWNFHNIFKFILLILVYLIIFKALKWKPMSLWLIPKGRIQVNNKIFIKTITTCWSVHNRLNPSIHLILSNHYLCVFAS